MKQSGSSFCSSYLQVKSTACAKAEQQEELGARSKENKAGCVCCNFSVQQDLEDETGERGRGKITEGLQSTVILKNWLYPIVWMTGICINGGR